MSSRTPPRSSGNSDVSSSSALEAVVPTLRVMRLQSPELHKPTAGCLDGQPLLHNALCLPDSLQVLVGESFTAYLGILNVHSQATIRRLSVSAHLQTPSQRWQLQSPLEGTGVDVPPGSAVDAIVAHSIEEPGQHILRVEVSYASVEGGTKTFRKFYRFQVVNPLEITATHVARDGDNACLVSVSVEYKAKPEEPPLVLANAEFLPAEGLVAQRIDKPATSSAAASALTTTSTTTTTHTQSQDNSPTASALLSATALMDAAGCMTPGSIVRYLFRVSTSDATFRGIAAGDKLGLCAVTWRKAMGETGRVISPTAILCPPTKVTQPSFVVHRSGWSVDVAAAAANRNRNNNNNNSNNNHLSWEYPVTVEPIDPPARMQVGVPTEVEFYVVNHSPQTMTLQIQFRLSYMSELAICGPSAISLGSVPGDGGSTAVAVKFLPLATGLLRAQGCWMVDLASNKEIAQPPLFHVFVEENDSNSIQPRASDHGVNTPKVLTA